MSRPKTVRNPGFPRGGPGLGFLCALSLSFALTCPGCSRTHYRTAADADAYGIVVEKSVQTPWEPEEEFHILPGQASRLFDPTPLDDPQLPIPAPQLYAYSIPDRRSSFPPPPTLGITPQDAPSPIVTAGAEAQEPIASPGPEPVDLDTSPMVLPDSAWEAIPDSALVRVLAFPRLRDEHARTFGRQPTAEEQDAARALSLEEIVDLALLNSREYQTQKERLYRAALRLTLERFQFDLKPSAGLGTNRAALDYRHTRNPAFGSQSTLSLPSHLQADKVLRTGGDLLASVANNIVLTFNGPEGFASDLNNELFVAVTQTVFQRDIRFEALTQAERNVVYAARDYARFRKVLFNQLCQQYYELLRTYRQIEIDALNYFTLVRALTQRGEELRIGFASRVQVDQIEQSSLAGLIALIGTGNRLEQGLDSLKLRMGLPTETRINLDLTELEQLTAADELAVAGQLMQRIRQRLQAEAGSESPDVMELLALSIDLVAQMQEALRLAPGTGLRTPDFDVLARWQTELELSQARLLVREQQSLLVLEQANPMASTMGLLQRHFQLLEALLSLLRQQHQAGSRAGAPQAAVEGISTTITQLSDRLRQAESDFGKALDELQLQQFEAVLQTGAKIREEAETAVQAADRTLGLDSRPADLFATLGEVNNLLDRSREVLDRLGGGLVPVEIGVDDAMITALVLRMDLMNQRGFLADNWRQIKLAADDLKSILNLSAGHRVDDLNWQDSETRLQVTFDAPFNRRAQRNQFREALIDYQAARRDLMEFEDGIKFAIRNDLRDLSLSKQQYDLGVASAALAFERVAGTRLQLQVGVAGVQARDFLEAQTAYAASLSTVALRHIGYILGRTQLFLDLELLEVDHTGFWPELRNDQYQPIPTFSPLTHAPPYGELPGGVDYSKEMRRMLAVPFGEAQIEASSVAGPTVP